MKTTLQIIEEKNKDIIEERYQELKQIEDLIEENQKLKAIISDICQALGMEFKDWFKKNKF